MKQKTDVKVCPLCKLPAIKGRGPLEIPAEAKKTGPTETDEINADSRVLTKLTSERIKTLEDLVRVAKIDTTEWEIERYVVNKWEGFNVPRTTRPDGNAPWARPSTTPVVTELWQVKAWMKRRRDLVAAKHEIELLKKKAEGLAPKYPAIILKNLRATGNLGEFSLHDHHFGSLIWGRETGGADYDTATAKQAYEAALKCLLLRTQGYGLDKAVVVFGSDQQNSDNRAGTTEKGTRQDNDSRYQKVFEISRDTSIWAVEALRSQIRAVDVVIVPGNHDPVAAWHLGDSLKAWFRRCDGVTVNNEPTARKYMRHGVCMLMWTHGSNGKLEDYPQTMAAEQPEMWGQTIWREAHTGDKHHRRLLELRGATVRILPSLRPPDAWSSENHFVGSIRAAEAYVWNDREALVGTGVYSILGKRTA